MKHIDLPYCDSLFRKSISRQKAISFRLTVALVLAAALIAKYYITY